MQRRNIPKLNYSYLTRLSNIVFSEDLWFLSSGLNNEFGLTFPSRAEGGLLSVKNCHYLLKTVRRLEVSQFLIKLQYKEHCEAEDNCTIKEFSVLLWSLEEVGTEVENLQWKFRQLAGYHVDSVSENNARFIFQVKHGEEFGKIVFEDFLTNRLQTTPRVGWSEIEESIYLLSPELDLIKKILLERESQLYFTQRFDPFSQQQGPNASADCLLEELRHAMACHNAALVDYCLQRLRQLSISNKLTRSAEQLLLSIRLAQDLRAVMTLRDRCKIRVVMDRIKTLSLCAKLNILCAEAEAMLKKLDKLEVLKAKVIDLSTSCLAEIKSYTMPPTIVHSLIKALLLLLGVPERDIQSWAQCQAQMVVVGKYSIKSRMADYQINCLEKNTARKANLLTQRLSIESILGVSTECVVLFKWVKAVLSEVLDKE